MGWDLGPRSGQGAHDGPVLQFAVTDLDWLEKVGALQWDRVVVLDEMHCLWLFFTFFLLSLKKTELVGLGGGFA